MDNTAKHFADKAAKWERLYRSQLKTSNEQEKEVTELRTELDVYKTAMSRAHENVKDLTHLVNEASYKGGENCDPRDLPDVPKLLDQMVITLTYLQRMTKGKPSL